MSEIGATFHSLNIIGCGKVGMTLAYLFNEAGCYQIKDIINKTFSSSEKSSNFLGSGTPIASIEELRPADVIMIAVNDDQLPTVIRSLVANLSVLSKTIVFHCSGAYTHEILLPLKDKGAHIASLHPIKSFSDPKTAIAHFKGTYCTLEGDDIACKELEKSLTSIGANVVAIPAKSKRLYHIAAIFSSNYFVTLIETSLKLFEQCNIEKSQGIEMLEPLVLGAWNQIKNQGTQKALTGPISRGDRDLVKNQLQTLSEVDKDMLSAYKALGKLTLTLAVKDQRLKPEEIESLESLFK